MPLVAKRGVRESWRNALRRKAGGRSREILAAFDGLLSSGRDEAEAAYRALEDAGLLCRVDEPRADAGDGPAVEPGAC